MVKVDQVTKQFTYFPFPELRAHTPKLDLDPAGVMWFTLRNASGPGIASLQANGNVPSGRGAAAQ